MTSLSLPLHCLPVLKVIGTNTHGHLPTEKYHFKDYFGLHIYWYAGQVTFLDQTLEFGPGFATLTPADTDLTWHFPKQATHYYALFEFPKTSGPLIALPLVKDLKENFSDFCKSFEEAISLFSVNPIHAQVILLDLLWRLSYQNNSVDKNTKAHPKLKAALIYIEHHLHEKISVRYLAHFLGISQTHLERLFRQATLKTIAGFIRNRKSEKALQLLKQSSAPIKTIAARVGVPDLHQFNKMMKKEFKYSPTRLRQN
jgi:AraC-like DNA-binding protein